MTLQRQFHDDSGFSLVTAMLALSLLALFGLVAAGVAVNEKRTTYNELAYNRSMLAADSGTEAAAAWLLTLDTFPKYMDDGHRLVRVENAGAFTNDAHQSFDYSVSYMDHPTIPGEKFVIPRGGYTADDVTMMDHIFEVDSEGESGVDGRGSVALVAHRLLRGSY